MFKLVKDKSTFELTFKNMQVKDIDYFSDSQIYIQRKDLIEQLKSILGNLDNQVIKNTKYRKVLPLFNSVIEAVRDQMPNLYKYEKKSFPFKLEGNTMLVRTPNGIEVAYRDKAGISSSRIYITSIELNQFTNHAAKSGTRTIITREMSMYTHWSTFMETRYHEFYEKFIDLKGYQK